MTDDITGSAARPIARMRSDAKVIENPTGGDFTYWARADETGGALTLIESVNAPGLGPPVHVHTHEDEFAYVLDGELRFELDEAIHEAPTGSSIFIPKGLRHTWQVTSDRPARFLFGFMPGAPGMERFFERAAALPSESRLADAFQRFSEDAGMEVVGPPLAQRG